MALLDNQAHDQHLVDLRDDDRPNEYAYDSEDGRSNFVAFLLGGVVITGGLLTFLYYDSSDLQGANRSDGYLSQLESPIGATAPRTAPSATRR